MIIPRYFSISEIATNLSISRRSVQREIAAGRLTAVRMTDRGDLRVTEESLKAWLANRTPAA
jgi:excisionase family DNA binding protein